MFEFSLSCFSNLIFLVFLGESFLFPFSSLCCSPDKLSFIWSTVLVGTALLVCLHLATMMMSNFCDFSLGYMTFIGMSEYLKIFSEYMYHCSCCSCGTYSYTSCSALRSSYSSPIWKLVFLFPLRICCVVWRQKMEIVHKKTLKMYCWKKSLNFLKKHPLPLLLYCTM